MRCCSRLCLSACAAPCAEDIVAPLRALRCVAALSTARICQHASTFADFLAPAIHERCLFYLLHVGYTTDKYVLAIEKRHVRRSVVMKIIIPTILAGISPVFIMYITYQTARFFPVFLVVNSKWRLILFTCQVLKTDTVFFALQGLIA